MKNILERFEKLAAAHGLNADTAAAMRGLLGDAHTAGYLQHQRVMDEISADEQDSLPATGRDEEPDDEDEKEEAKLRTLTTALRKELRKTLKKEVRKAVHKQLQRVAPQAQ